ncbi:hypothetical protein BJV74DRAFT_799715 [Russula compacta]|nr:hypothetical protein BJV74DRAFT_799715 [Russula compacta]
MNSWAPFKNQVQFKLADFLYTHNQMPAQQINTLLDIWAKSLCNAGGQPLYSSYKDLYGTINAIPLSNIKWQSFTMNYKGMPDNNKHSPWMEDMYCMMSGFGVPSRPSTICLVIQSLKARWTSECTMNLKLNQATNAFKTLCWVIGPRNNCDKMTVLVTTGQHDYYPLYLSLIPWQPPQWCSTVTLPWCGPHWFSGNTKKPYIADYKEQALLTCIVYNWCASLLQMISCCCFKQWTGNDSKALMKVYLVVIKGFIPLDVLHMFRAFLEFCYLVHKDVITQPDLIQLQDALSHFHHYREVFKTMEVVQSLSLPCQHSLSHYLELIKQFGALNVKCNKTQHRLDKQHNALLMQEDFLAPEAVASHHEDPEDSKPVDDQCVDVFVQLVKSHLSATFYAPSDLCGKEGMWQEYI